MTSQKSRHPEIVKDIVRRIECGQISGRMPTTRDTVEYYRASSRTILKVWDKLKADGIIYTRPGKGTYIKKRS